MEQLEHALLEPALEVDEEVPARDEVEVRERRVLEQAVRREQDRLAEPLGHAVAPGRPPEKAPQPLGAHVGLDGLGVDPGPADGDGPLAEVGGEHLDPGRGGQRRGVLGEQDGDRVRLLAGRAPGHPHADLVVEPLPLEQGGDDRRLEDLERVGVAEKVGDGDEEVVEQLARLARRLPEVREVAAGRAGADDVHPPGEPPEDRRAPCSGRSRGPSAPSGARASAGRPGRRRGRRRRRRGAGRLLSRPA